MSELKELSNEIFIKKKLVILFTLLFVILGATFNLANQADKYHAKLKVKLAKRKNEKFLDDHSHLSFILERRFKSHLTFNPVSNLYELSSISTDEKKAKENIKDAFSFTVKRHENLSKNITLETPTESVGSIAVSKLSPKVAKNIILPSLKLGLLSFIFSALIILFTKLYFRLKNERANVY
ncbi:MAG: hypothetical protein K9K67_00750 [Bacteriovoracaceae bacterium]|nr:hypothetical protein [Bacteriovoracaceae bacterium]